MLKLSVYLWLLCFNLFCAEAQLTDDAQSVDGTLRALAQKTSTHIDSRLVAHSEQAYQKLSSDSQYRKAHKLYRLLAAMTLTGDENLLKIVDQVWASGLSRSNHLLQAIGLQWGNAEANKEEKTIYQGRFMLEVKRQKDGSSPLTTFAHPQDWKGFFVQNKNTYITFFERTNDARLLSYANTLWKPLARPSWCYDLFLTNQEPSQSSVSVLDKETGQPKQSERQTILYHQSTLPAICGVSFVPNLIRGPDGGDESPLGNEVSNVYEAFKQYVLHQGRDINSTNLKPLVVHVGRAKLDRHLFGSLPVESGVIHARVQANVGNGKMRYNRSDTLTVAMNDPGQVNILAELTQYTFRSLLNRNFEYQTYTQ